jgi:hypothetical protein
VSCAIPRRSWFRTRTSSSPEQKKQVMQFSAVAAMVAGVQRTASSRAVEGNLHDAARLVMRKYLLLPRAAASPCRQKAEVPQRCAKIFRRTVLAFCLAAAALTVSPPAWSQSGAASCDCVFRTRTRCGELLACRAGETEVARDPFAGPFDPRIRACPDFNARFPREEILRCCRPCVPRCVWRGTAPFCAGSCNRGETRIGPSAQSSGSGRHRSATERARSEGFTVSGFGRSCFSGTKVQCCRRPAASPVP